MYTWLRKSKKKVYHRFILYFTKQTVSCITKLTPLFAFPPFSVAAVAAASGFHVRLFTAVLVEVGLFRNVSPL